MPRRQVKEVEREGLFLESFLFLDYLRGRLGAFWSFRKVRELTPEVPSAVLAQPSGP